MVALDLCNSEVGIGGFVLQMWEKLGIWKLLRPQELVPFLSNF